jgi:hypothetical protein
VAEPQEWLEMLGLMKNRACTRSFSPDMPVLIPAKPQFSQQRLEYGNCRKMNCNVT